MSTMKQYFNYECKSSCGLSKITLLSEIDDWIDLKKNRELNQFDSKNVKLTYLLPVLDTFIESANGNPDSKRWNQILWWCNKTKNQKWPRVNGNSIPNGFLSTPMKLIQGGNQYNSTIYSGHFASKLLDNNSKLIPSLDCIINW
ncbi:hypothetical protein ACTA71_000211 [Dictyostelium dimigraforme]